MKMRKTVKLFKNLYYSIVQLYYRIKYRDKPRYGYMCGVDYQHELGEAMGGCLIYPSIKDLKRDINCWNECGIIKVKVKLVEWIEVQDFSKIGTVVKIEKKK